MSIWAKIGIEIVLALLVTFFGYIFGLLSRMRLIFDSMLLNEERIAWSLEYTAQAHKREEARFVEEALALDSEYFTERGKYSLLLIGSYLEALQFWKREKWACFVVFLAILVGSFFLYWPFTLVNLLIFWLHKHASKLSTDASDSSLPVKDVATQVSLIARLIQSWMKVDPKGCKSYCTENPRFATVYRVVSENGKVLTFRRS
jgi:hypothetical protein